MKKIFIFCCSDLLRYEEISRTQKAAPFVLVFVFFFSFGNQNIQAQDPIFGEVTKNILSMEKDPDFPEASAVILNRSVEVEVGGYVVVKEQVKIFNKEGYDFATIEFPYRNIEKITGQTYNLIDDKIVITKLNKKMVLGDDSKTIKFSEMESFTMPQVKEGSVFEYVYRATRKTYSDIYLQFNIPKNK